MTQFNPSSRGKIAGLRAGFTLVELIIAGVLAILVLGAVTFTLSQLGRARNLARDRVEAYQRASTALDAIRTDVASVMRSDDLFDCRFLLSTHNTRSSQYDRSELLVFNSSLRAVREIDYQGEGLDYETGYRVEDDELGSALWRRRDPVPDEIPSGGGVAEPVADGIMGVKIEASDGLGSWLEEWDSDYDGLPKLVRISVTSTGAEVGTEPTDATPEVTLRTVVAIPRLVPPRPDAPKEDPATAGAGAGDTAPPASGTNGGRTPSGGGTVAPPAELAPPGGGGVRGNGGAPMGRPASPAGPAGGGNRGAGGGRGAGGRGNGGAR